MIKKQAQVGVLGAGVMGIGIAQIAAAQGHSVVLFDQSFEILNAAIAGLEKRLSKRVSANRMTEQAASDLVANIQLADSLDAVADAALVIEVIIENIEIKQQVYAQLEDIVANDTIIASNTSSFSISALARNLRNPARFVGMHFFNPAPVLKLVEVVSGVQTSTEVAETIYALAKEWGKHPVKVVSSPGFIVNRVARPYYAEGLRSLNEGVGDAATLDAIMRHCGGFKLGPFELIDLIGLDVNQAATESVYQAFYQDPRFRPSVLLREKVDAGLLGRKSGEGFYQYGEGNTKPEVDYRSNPQPVDVGPVMVHGDLGVAQDLVKLIESSDLELSYQASDSAYIELTDVELRLTDGRTAASIETQRPGLNVVLLDLALDYEQCEVLTVCAAESIAPQTLARVVEFIRRLQKKVVVIKDVPGMQVMRTVCMLANEAGDVVNQGVADADSVDAAMQLGVAYPRGPLAWARDIGYSRVVDTLSNIQNAYQEERYRVSPWLRSQSYH